MKEKVIIFKSLDDFKKRIANLWINQKEDESYKFIFPDDKTKKSFDDLTKSFAEGQQGRRL